MEHHSYKGILVFAILVAIPQLTDCVPGEDFIGVAMPQCSEYVCGNFTAEDIDHAHCRCDNDCVIFGDCCYDVYTSIYNITTLEELQALVDEKLKEKTLTEPLKLHWINVVKNYGKCTANFGFKHDASYSLISSCPDHTEDKALVEKCEDISEEFLTEVPVSYTIHRSITVAFRNIYCSACHGIPANLMDAWMITVKDGCVNKDIDSGLDNRILPYSDIKSTCINVKDKPESIAPFRFECAPKTNFDCESNTGQTYNDFICNSFILAVHYYIEGSQFKYRNPHCIMCPSLENSNETECSHLVPPSKGQGQNLRPKPEYSISVLFNFRGDGLSVQIDRNVYVQNEDLCESNFIYDTVLQTCIEIVCPDSGRFTNKGCIYDETSWTFVTAPESLSHTYKILNISFLAIIHNLTTTKLKQNVEEMYQGFGNISIDVSISDSYTLSNYDDDHKARSTTFDLGEMIRNRFVTTTRGTLTTTMYVLDTDSPSRDTTQQSTTSNQFTFFVNDLTTSAPSKDDTTTQSTTSNQFTFMVNDLRTSAPSEDDTTTQSTTSNQFTFLVNDLTTSAPSKDATTTQSTASNQFTFLVTDLTTSAPSGDDTTTQSTTSNQFTFLVNDLTTSAPSKDDTTTQSPRTNQFTFLVNDLTTSATSEDDTTTQSTTSNQFTFLVNDLTTSAPSEDDTTTQSTTSNQLIFMVNDLMTSAPSKDDTSTQSTASNQFTFMVTDQLTPGLSKDDLREKDDSVAEFKAVNRSRVEIRLGLTRKLSMVLGQVTSAIVSVEDMTVLPDVEVYNTNDSNECETESQETVVMSDIIKLNGSYFGIDNVSRILVDIDMTQFKLTFSGGQIIFAHLHFCRNKSLNCTMAKYKMAEFVFLENGTLIHNISRRVYEKGAYLITGTDVLACIDLSSMTSGMVSKLISSHEWLLSLIVESVSVVCLFVTSIVYCECFGIQTSNRLCVMCLSITLGIAQGLFLIQINLQTVACKVKAVGLHFFWLSSFLWMLVIGFDYAKTFRVGKTELRQKSNTLGLKYLMFAYGIPFAFVAICIFIDEFVPSLTIGYGLGGVCWIGNQTAYRLVFALPVCIMILLNMLFFVCTVLGINRAKFTKISSTSAPNRSFLIIYVKLSVIMGLTWVFGFIAGVVDNTVLWYCYIIPNGLQGLDIFLMFVLNKTTIKQLRKSKKKAKASSKTFSLSNSNGTSISSIQMQEKNGN